MFLRACALACLLGAPALARAAPRVLVRDSARAQPGLCDALRIQLTSSAVRCVESGEADMPLAAQIASVARDVRSEAARIGVFVVPGSGADAAQLIVVGEREDSAILVFEPRRGGSANDIDRSLALKVVETLDALTQADQDAAARASSAPEGDVTAHRGALAAALGAAPGSRQLALLIEGAYGMRITPAVVSVAGVAAGLRIQHAVRALELTLGAALPSLTRAQGAVGALELRRFDYALALRFLRTFSRLELGAAIAAGLSDLRASAVSASGERGRGQTLRGEVQLTALLRVRLFATAYLGLAPSLAVSPASAALVVDDTTLLHLPRTRFDLPLVLGVRTP